MQKVFGIGLSRTGTKSLSAALKLLGFRTVHFPSDSITRLEIERFYAAPTTSLKLSSLKSYDGAVDTPIASCFRALDLAYPESLFVYTTRSMHDWLWSCKEYWNAFLHPQFEKPTIGRALLDYMRAVNYAVYGVDRFDPERFAVGYERHDAAVRSNFADRPERLLVLPICEGAGWETLCPFLDRAVPGLPFPYRNRMR